jgi:hypothetical protein
MSNFNQELFNGKTFSDILNEIYKNSKKKEKQINSLISELKPLIENLGDAVSVVPLIKEYLEIGVKNDEHLIKMAAIAQRSMGTGGGSNDDYALSEEEMKELEEIAKESNQYTDEPKRLE